MFLESIPLVPAGPIRRWRRWVLLFGFLLLGGGIAVLWVWARWSANMRLEQAIAEANRLDPGWRLDDLMSTRRAIDPKTNSANRVLAAARGIPEAWPDDHELLQAPPLRPSSDAEEPAASTTPEFEKSRQSAAAIEDAVRSIPPNLVLGDELRKALELVLRPVEGAIAGARSLAGASEGRYEITFGEIAIAPDRPDIENVRRVSRLLFLDSARKAESEKIDEALTSARGLIGVARSVGDEPTDLSQLFRAHVRRSVITAIVRALGQGEAADATLAAVQEDLLHEGEHELLLCAMRAQRAACFDVLGKMTEGAYERYAVGDFRPAGPSDAGDVRARANPITLALGMRAYGRYNQALALSLLNHAVEGAKCRPSDQGWFEHWTEYEKGLEEGNWIKRRLGATAFSILLLNNSLIWMTTEFQARAAALRVLLAAERYRRAVGSWPDKPAQLVPKYLAEIPRGPYSAKPIRYVRRADSVVAYAVGIGGQDNGGRLNPNQKRHGDPNYDVGVQLWNPELRHRSGPISASANN